MPFSQSSNALFCCTLFVSISSNHPALTFCQLCLSEQIVLVNEEQPMTWTDQVPFDTQKLSFESSILLLFLLLVLFIAGAPYACVFLSFSSLFFPLFTLFSQRSLALLVYVNVCICIHACALSPSFYGLVRFQEYINKFGRLHLVSTKLAQKMSAVKVPDYFDTVQPI